MKEERNTFLYKDEKLGELQITEIAPNQCELRKLKQMKSEPYILNVAWWDLDGLKKQLKEERKEIQRVINCGINNGNITKLNEVKNSLDRMPKEDTEKCLGLINETIEILKRNL